MIISIMMTYYYIFDIVSIQRHLAIYYKHGKLHHLLIPLIWSSLAKIYRLYQASKKTLENKKNKCIKAKVSVAPLEAADISKNQILRKIK